MNFYKINTEGYPEVGSGKTLPDGYAEFTVEVAEDGSKTYSPAELNDAMLVQVEQEVIDNQIADAKQYLSNTDWYYARKLEEGTEVPADVVAKRIELRALINSLQG